MHTKSGSIISSSSWTSTGSYCSTSWSHCWHTNVGLNTKLWQRQWAEVTPGPHLGLHGVWQEAADFPHSFLNLGFCRIFLQDAVDVRDNHLTNLTVATNIKARPVQGSWNKIQIKQDVRGQLCQKQVWLSFNVEVWNRRELTNICTAGIVTESQHCADSLGVCLLHQQLNDGFAVRFNQVFALAPYRGRQVRAHFLHSLNHLLLWGKAELSQSHSKIKTKLYKLHLIIVHLLQALYNGPMSISCAIGNHHGDTWNYTSSLFLFPSWTQRLFWDLSISNTNKVMPFLKCHYGRKR